MGFFKRKRDWIPGQAEVIATNEQDNRSQIQAIIVRAMITKPECEPYDSQKQFLIPHWHWLKVGETVPVKIDPNDPHNWEVLWNETEVGLSRRRSKDKAKAKKAGLSDDVDTIQTKAPKKD